MKLLDHYGLETTLHNLEIICVMPNVSLYHRYLEIGLCYQAKGKNNCKNFKYL